MKNRLDLTADDAVLIDQFSLSAMRNGEAADASDYRNANRQHDIAVSISRELRRRGRTSQNSLLPLLTDVKPWVRYWAAVATVDFAAPDSTRVLRALADARISPTLTLNAELILAEWEKGTLEVV